MTVRLRPKPRPSTRPHQIAVFTSVDGTLVDAHTFETGAARAAIRRLQTAGIPVVPVTVMTLEEIAPIAASLRLHHAMVVEAGGAIARWQGERWEVEPCGPPAETILDIVREIEDRSGANLLIYSALEDTEAGRLSGRKGDMLQASRHRCFSEPFVIETGGLAAVKEAAAAMGFSVRHGRRFLHLCRQCDEGEAFLRVRDELQCSVAVALGGVPVDAEFLSRSEIPIIVPGPDGVADPELVKIVPNARIAPAAGPEGWAAAVDEVVQSLVGGMSMPGLA